MAGVTRAEYEDAPVAADVVNGGEGFVRVGACFVRIHSGPNIIVVAAIFFGRSRAGCSGCDRELVAV